VFVTDPAATGFDDDGLRAAVAVLDGGLGDLHDGYQLYVSRHGVPVVDTAAGDAAPGRPMTVDSIPLWFSSSKPATAVAVAILWERGLLDLDDTVAAHWPEFGCNGKETATVRHLLTHRGGFPFADFGQATPDWESLVATVASAPVMYEPGTQAGYHATAGWVALGRLVEVVDGRRIDRFCAEEIFAPLGMDSSQLVVETDRVEELRPRLGEIRATLPSDDVTYPLFDLPQWNTDDGIASLSPGASGRGPAHDLARLHEMILGRGTRDGVRILDARTVEAITAGARVGVTDTVLGITGGSARHGVTIPWGLGFAMQSDDYGPLASHRAVGHSGHASSTAFSDPECGIVVAIVTNGLPGFDANTDRMSSTVTAVYRAAGFTTRIGGE
jgi:CubicO group peptidase (beta-lactamase class C family)